MAASVQATNLERPPEYRGGDAKLYCIELSRWALRYYLMVNTIVQRSQQAIANFGAVAPLTQTIDNPPTQAQVIAIQNTVNALISAATSIT